MDRNLLQPNICHIFINMVAITPRFKHFGTLLTVEITIGDFCKFHSNKPCASTPSVVRNSLTGVMPCTLSTSTVL